MPEKRPNRGVRFLVAACVGALLGGGMGWAIIGFTRSINPVEETPVEAARPADTEAPAGMPEEPAGDPAMRYARAMSEGDWAAVIAQTVWMQERLSYAALGGGGEAARAEAMQALEESLSDRLPVEAQLLPEGVEDKYVFSPGAELVWVGQDEGRQDLAFPAAHRTWIRVTYPNEKRALQDEVNLPIQSILVGVNVTEDGEVLKANIVGNLDINLESISYAWR